MSERFGPLLRQFRLAAGFSQEYVAERARLSTVSISALERGLRAAPYRQTVERIVAALGLNEEQANALKAAAETRERGNLPVGTLPLVGRAADLANLARLVKPGRVLTVTGTGGVGKTRIAIELASELHALGPPVFVDLAPATSGSMVCDAIASAVANTTAIAHLDPESLARSFGAKRVLIILDTCEHVLPDVAEVVATMVRSCPRVTLLATSRRRIGVRGETVYRLAPLPTPPGPVADLHALASFASVELFIQRATSFERGVAFTNGNAEAVAAICRALDGIPLSIELAAPRVGSLGLQALAARLRENAELANVHRDAPPRHRSSFASIGWSYRLLTEGERRIFRHLSAFPGTFTLEAAEEACAAAGVDENGVSEALSSLVEQNLIEVESLGTATRYWLLNTVRTFASNQGPEAAADMP